LVRGVFTQTVSWCFVRPKLYSTKAITKGKGYKKRTKGINKPSTKINFVSSLAANH